MTTDPTATDLAALKKDMLARPADGWFQTTIHNLIAAVEALRERLAGYDTIFDLAQERECPWIEAWRKASGKPNTLPDYGEMMGWLCGRIEVAETRVAELELAASVKNARHGKALGDRAEAAEARVAVLTEALAFYRADDERAVEGGILESVFDRPATAALAKLDALGTEGE